MGGSWEERDYLIIIATWVLFTVFLVKFHSPYPTAIYSLILLLQRVESSLPSPGWASCFLSFITSSFLFSFFVCWLVSYLLLTPEMIKNMSLLKSANKLFMTQKRSLLVIWLNWSHMDYLPPKSKWQSVGERESLPQHWAGSVDLIDR